MADLSTKYMGLTLQNPLVVSPSTLCKKIDNIKKMEDAGAGAVVLHSLFEEQIILENQEIDRYLTQGTDTYAESLTYFPNVGDFWAGPDEYLEHIRKAKNAVKIPIIASLNGVSSGGWISYAKEFESAGADAIELNIYYIPTDPDMVSQQVEYMYIDVAKNVKDSVKIPVAIKISPFFSSMAYMAKQFDQLGIDALVMFNRFYQPDFDLKTMTVTPNLVLSTSDELRLRLRWVAILYGRIKADMAVTGGVHTVDDVIKSILAGANVAMMTSAIMKNGINHITRLKNELAEWMDKHEYKSLNEIRGKMSQQSVKEPSAFERANYMKVIKSYSYE
ncbi:TPA: dihydroorotate dehydrogenase-like protein [Candidatus Poribacteria bacterium]|nr:dihydroorotate dehydrogenase-like protein [Candidatus Poribacteria bacterium]